jgi:hypothetical protein
MVIGLIAAGLILTVPMPGWEHAYFLGLLTAALIGTVGWVVYVSAGNHNQHYGMLGEEATAEAVLTPWRRLKGWRLVNGLYFDGHGDVDHILIGPKGIFAIESKWTNVPWSIRDDAIVRAIFQARRGAHKVENALRFESAIHLPVVPIVVLWGRGSPAIDRGSAMVDGVLLAEGRRKRMWVKQLDEIQLDRSRVRLVAEKLVTDLNTRDDARIAQRLTRQSDS